MSPRLLPLQTEVLVIGAGLAGHCAALAAAEAGALVCLIEKTPQFGGSSAQAVGGFAFAGTDLQAEAGIDDNAEILRQDFLKAGESRNDPRLLELLLDCQLDAYHWLKRHGAIFSYAKPSMPGSAMHIHGTGQAQAIQALHEQVLGNPQITYVAGAGAKRLLRDRDAATVSGAVVEHSSNEHDIRVTGGVVLSTGGFSRSRRLLEAFAPELLDAIRLGGVGNSGDGMLMANALGAGLADMGWVTGTFGVALPHYPDLAQRPDDLPGLLFSFYSGAIIVNLDGRRFASESASYKSLGGLCASQPKGIAFQLFDQKTMDLSRASPAHNFKAALERGEVRKADTLDVLAKSIGIEPRGLRETIERYNADAHSPAATDTRFGRKIPMKIDQPHFYAYPCGVAVTTTLCGLTIDPQMRVLDVFGDSIPGLFAAGEMVAGFHGSNYMSGTALTKAAVTGLLAGMHAAGAPSAHEFNRAKEPA